MSVIEFVWTIIPALILLAIAGPSFELLYIMDEVLSPTLTIKVVGHQWYWSYFPPTLVLSYMSLDTLLDVNLIHTAAWGQEGGLFLISGIISSNSPIVDARLLTSSNIPKIPSKNRKGTLAVLESALNSNILSGEVRQFIYRSARKPK